MRIIIRTLNGLYRGTRLGLMYVLNGADRINSLYTSFSSLSSSCVRNSMRVKKKISFVKVCDSWLTKVALIDSLDIVNKIPLEATEKPCMKSICPTLGMGIVYI